MREIHAATGLPVTCKIRSGWDDKSLNYLQVAGQLFEAGCAALAIHPRTREQGYSGQADWSVIADLKRHFPDRPIIGNGDVKTPADARRMLETHRLRLRDDWPRAHWATRGSSASCSGASRPPRRSAASWCWSTSPRTSTSWAMSSGRCAPSASTWPGTRTACAAPPPSAPRSTSSTRPRQVRDAVRRFFGSAHADPNAPDEEQDVDYRAALG